MRRLIGFEYYPPLPIPRRVSLVGMLVIVVALAIWPLYASPFLNNTVSMILTYAVVGMGLNLLTGYTGQISIGHNAFVAFGGYTAAILAMNGIDMLWAFPIAAVLCYVVGLVIGLPALRMGNLQFALVTLALAMTLPAILKRFSFLTNGFNGISLNILAPEWTGLARDQWVFYICLLVAVLAMYVSTRLAGGRIGRSLVAVRDFENVARSVGVRTAIVKTQIFAISAIFAGIGGVLYAFVVRFVSAESFGLGLAIAFITMIVVGGLSTTAGAVFGAIFVQLVPVWTSSIGPGGASVAYGITLVAFIFLAPAGIVGLLRRGGHALLSRRKLRRARSELYSGHYITAETGIE
ncbi:branched-chain amino acid ABC transporter permease [Microbacterium sp. BWT-B31]|uniref:branched-chain amino acid ABC transporter permease n=1 Tax=Microbacterium sp. BWT-B31 TaxID=3232072 RepID=UPI003528761F